MAHSLALATEVDEAARTGLDAYALAVGTESARTMTELRNLARRLEPEARRPAVRDLREAVLTG